MSKLITISENLLQDILPHVKNTPNPYPPNSPNLPNPSSIELARLGMAQVVVYQHKRPFIYQDQLLKLQEEAKKKKLGMWSS
ncbi:thermonuclease family protein [Candidatus Daviesbacteria bacterium]|nr:thermonuclease family protein [Candidatus Daviesbacteria bacterium]